jgi:DNA mismatch repair protein MutS
MKKIVRWGASKSYGIDVAKIAGIPSVILEKAKQNLASLQNKNWELKIENWESNKNPWTFNFELQAPSENPRYEKIKRFLDGFDLNSITPLQALQLLSKVKDDLSE